MSFSLDQVPIQVQGEQFTESQGTSTIEVSILFMPNVANARFNSLVEDILVSCIKHQIEALDTLSAHEHFEVIVITAPQKSISIHNDDDMA